jgi:hypothetical protein
VIGGKLGRGVIALSDEQMMTLIDRMGVDLFDYYCEKLANYIIKNDATVKSHFETMLKWFTEDNPNG